MGGSAAVLAELGVGGDGGARGDFALQPGGEGGLAGDFAGGAEAGDDGGGVVAGRVGEVAEVEGRFHGGIGRGEIELASGEGPRDVGRHAEGVDGRDVAESRGVEAKGDLVAVHHYVGDAGRVSWAGEEDTCVGVHGCLVGGHGLVQFPHYDAFRVVDEVVADAGDGGDDGDVEGG